MKVINYRLRVEIEGQYEDQAIEGGPGAGEGRRKLEETIRNLKFLVASTNIRVVRLEEINRGKQRRKK
jgi:hypothetical protein